MTWRVAAAAPLLLGLAIGSCSQPRDRAAANSASAPAPPAQNSAATRPLGPPVVLARGRKTMIAIHAPPRLRDVESPAKSPRGSKRPRLSPREKVQQKKQLQDAKLLAASVRDLATYLGKMANVEIPIVWGPSEPGATNRALPLLVGELADQRFGPPLKHVAGKQGFRVVVQSDAIGVAGESDLATSYAIYELLDRLGCRWFMPGELGEEVPQLDPLTLDRADDSLAPDTLYRGLWLADQDFARRNRLGGLKLSAAHMLERWISPEQRSEHPEWRAQINGRAHDERLRWSSPEVASAIAAGIEAQLEKRPADSVSLSPGDGSDFDDATDRALDAGDWDPTVNRVSLSDRLMVLSNRVAQKLHDRHPDLLFGVLAYAMYTRPPIRERVHPNVVPVIAPITYCRAHAWADDRCPGAKDLRAIIEGWSKHSDKLAFRGYGFNLAEPAAPFPLMSKWSQDLPYLFAHKTSFFQPETLPNFETSLPGLYLAIRLSWRTHQAPSAVLEELFQRFYGHAAPQARAYWQLVDRAWTDVPEYSGGGLGHARRFTPELLQKADAALSDARRACKTEPERQRVAMLEQSLAQLRLYMKMDTDFKRGKLEHLSRDLMRWLDESNRLADVYEVNAAFAKTRWAKGSVYANYVERFLQPLYLEADRIAREETSLLAAPLCSARYRLDPKLALPSTAPAAALTPSDGLTDFCNETWSTLGQHDYFGAMWYEAELDLKRSGDGQRTFVWLSKVDGVAQAWLNGVAVKPKDAGSDAPASAETHLKSLTFEVTGAVRRDGPNRLTVAVKRTRVAELGAGGLMGPIYVYRHR